MFKSLKLASKLQPCLFQIQSLRQWLFLLYRLPVGAGNDEMGAGNDEMGADNDEMGADNDSAVH